MKADNNRIQQAIIAREIVDLYRNSPDKYEVAESLSSLCFAMARLTDCDKVDYPIIDWDDLAGNFDGILLIVASVFGMVIGFAVCLAESLHIYTKIGFLAMVEFIISPPTWTILWKANPMAVLSLLFSIGLSIYIILWVWRISKRAVL